MTKSNLIKALFVTVLAFSGSGGVAHAQQAVKPYVLIIFDTSGSMSWTEPGDSASVWPDWRRS